MGDPGNFNDLGQKLSQIVSDQELHKILVEKGLRAYPKSQIDRNVIKAHAKCSIAR